MKNCKDALKAATKGSISEEKAAELVRAFGAELHKIAVQQPDWGQAAMLSEAAKRVTIEQVKAVKISKRARAYANKARKLREADYGRMTGPADIKVAAMLVGDERAGPGGLNSVDAMGQAMATSLLGDMEQGLKKADVWSRWTGFGRDAELEKATVIEMARLNGGAEKATGNEIAEKTAKVLNGLIERSRTMQNDAGAWIDKIDGYVVRQSHDPLKVGGGFFGKMANEAENFAVWRDDMLRLVDTEKTFDGVKPAEWNEYLYQMWLGITSGTHDVLAGADDIEGFVPKAGTARRVSAGRKIHYKSAEAWFEYNEKYGRGGLMKAVIDQLDRAGRNAALMKRFGPDPESSLRADIQRLSGAANVTSAERKGLNQPRIKQYYEQVSGMADAPANLKFAKTMQVLRRSQSVAKLGSMVLSAIPDLAVSTAQLARAGVPVFEAMTPLFEGISRLASKERQEIALDLDAGARAMIGKLTSGFDMKDGAIGFYGTAARINMQFQGFEIWNDALRTGVATIYSRHLARLADKGFDQLDEASRSHLTRYGITATDWQAMRKGVSVDDDGSRYLTFDNLEDGIANKGRMLIQEMMDNATSEARAKEQVVLSFNTQAGTKGGEFMRSIMQFLSFPVTYYNRTLGPMINDAADKKTLGAIAPLVALIAGGTILGYVSVAAKDLVKGRTPRPMVGDHAYKTWIAAMVQGGGLGIYGDFLFAEHNRQGQGALETIGGPLWGDFWSLAQIGQALLNGIGEGDPEKRSRLFDNAANDSVRLVKGQIPLVNLWYTRTLLDAMIWWDINEMMRPGWAERTEDRVEREQGQGWWLRPTEQVEPAA